MIKNDSPKLHKAIFLDRDGTLCEEVNYLSRPADLRLYDFSADAVKLLRNKGFLIIVITNQSGIGRGFFDEKTLHLIHQKLTADLASQGTKLDAIYFCPHISADQCVCRKPKTGLIEEALEDFSIDPANSWMIGDKASDIETGFNAGMHTALVLTGYGRSESEKLSRPAELIGQNLFEIAQKINIMDLD